MNFITKYFLLAISLLLVSSAVPLAKAHFQDMEQPVTGILHVNPDDSPIVGEPATLVLFIVDSKNSFTFDSCDCTLFVTGPDEFESRTFLTRNGESEVTFPKKGKYIARFTGKNNQGVEIFDLSYTISVTRESVETGSQIAYVHTPYLVCFFIFLLLIPIAIYTLKNVVWNKNKKSRK